MEKAHRENNIEDFCIRLYRQIESIIKFLSKDITLSNVVSKMMNVPYLVINSKDPQVDKRLLKEDKNKQPIMTIADFALTKLKNHVIDNRKSTLLSEQKATDMTRLVLYFVCFGGIMRYGTMYDLWKEQVFIFSTIYFLRNRVHGGIAYNETDTAKYNNIKSNTTFYFYKLASFLFFLIDGVKRGFPLSEELVQFAEHQSSTILY